jgi:hypothetical protein
LAEDRAVFRPGTAAVATLGRGMHGSSHIVRAAAIVAAAALALLTAGCGGSRPSPASDRSRIVITATTSVAPNHRGTISVGSVEQCMKSDECPHALVRQVLDQERNFTRCMRSRGVPNWPAPTIDSRGRPVFVVSIGKDGFNPYSSPVWAKTNKCSRLMPDLPGAPFQVSP